MARGTSLRPPPDGPTPPLLVSYAEAARLLGGVTTDHIGRLVRRGELRAAGDGKARGVVYSSLLSYVEREAGND